MKKLRPFRFGMTSNGATTREAWLALARKAEAQGFSTLLISDHLHNQIGPVSALVAAADVTTTLRVSSFMFANDFRHPLFLAQEAASIDLLSGGRFELGLGTGWLLKDYENSGIVFDPPGVRIARMEEAVQVVKGCWGDQPFTFSGAHYKVKELNVLPKPTQKPRPPIMIGGGAQHVLSIAAREADIVSINFKSTRVGWADLSSIRPEAIDQRIQWVREAAGDRFEALELNNFAFIAAVTDQRRQAAQQALQNFGETIEDANIDEWLASPMVLVGTVGQIIQDLQMRRERFGISYVVLRHEVADAFAPVLERLVGTQYALLRARSHRTKYLLHVSNLQAAAPPSAATCGAARTSRPPLGFSALMAGQPALPSADGQARRSTCSKPPVRNRWACQPAS